MLEVRLEGVDVGDLPVSVRTERGAGVRVLLQQSLHVLSVEGGENTVTAKINGEMRLSRPAYFTK